MNSRLALALLAPVLAGSILAGCGAGDVVDDQKASIAVRFDVQDATGAPIKSASCPADVPVEVGRTFECGVVARSGDRAIATLEITSDRADLRVVDLRKP